MMHESEAQLQHKLVQQLSTIYQDIALSQSLDDIAKQLMSLMRLPDDCPPVKPFTNHWSEQDVVLITYGDSVVKDPYIAIFSLQL